MPKQPLTRHQRGIVKRYYANHGTIKLQKLQELVSELYLASGKKADQLWKRAETHLASVKCDPPIPDTLVRKVIDARDTEGLARLLGEIDARA
ncbi:MAG: hypothetical protein AAFR38_01430 [Planctomycetota bacterium]